MSYSNSAKSTIIWNYCFASSMDFSQNQSTMTQANYALIEKLFSNPTTGKSTYSVSQVPELSRKEYWRLAQIIDAIETPCEHSDTVVHFEGQYDVRLQDIIDKLSIVLFILVPCIKCEIIYTILKIQDSRFEGGTIQILIVVTLRTVIPVTQGIGTRYSINRSVRHTKSRFQELLNKYLNTHQIEIPKNMDKSCSYFRRLALTVIKPSGLVRSFSKRTIHVLGPANCTFSGEE